jgi:PmbA protein
MTNKNLEQLLTLAIKAGATHAEVYQVRSHSRPVLFEGNRLKQLESSQGVGTALRLWQEGCPGLAVAYGEVAAKTLVDKAISLAKLNSPETIELAEARKDIYPPLGTYIPPEDLIEMGRGAIAQLRDAHPEIICSAEFECEEETTTLINSLGFYGEYTDISLSYYLGVELVRGEDFLGIYDGECSKDKVNCDRIVQQILQRLDWAKTNATAPTGKLPVLLTANAATLLWETVSAALNGKRVWEGSSPWSESKGSNETVQNWTTLAKRAFLLSINLVLLSISSSFCLPRTKN